MSTEDWDHPSLSEEEFEERMHLLLDKIDRDIATHGMSVISVPGEETIFSYTIGLWCHQMPELIICGPSPNLAHSILTCAYDAMKNGETFREGVENRKVLVGYPVRFKEVPYPGSPLNIARRFHRSDHFPALQILFPDREGRFPGDEGYSYPEGIQRLPVDKDE